MNIPLVTRLTGAGVGPERSSATKSRSTTTECASGSNGLATPSSPTRRKSQKDSADIFGEAKPLLSDWGKELQRDELIAA
jgi:hypothetical protein